MKGVVNYDSDSDGDHSKKPKVAEVTTPFAPIKINPKPSADTTALVLQSQEEKNQILAKYYKEAQPSNHLTGNVEEWSMHNYNFDEQYYSFNKYGIAHDPNPESNRLVINHSIKEEGYTKKPNIEVVQGNDHNYAHLSVYNMQIQDERKRRDEISKKRKRVNDPSRGDFQGPWAAFENEGDDKFNTNMELDEERKGILTAIEEKRKQKMEELKAAEEFEITSTFHGDNLFDYKGRSYILPPTELKPKDHTCFIPKKLLHTWSGHTKGIMAARFFPQYGHYVLSGSMDGQVKLWDVYNDKRCVRTYSGHKDAVRDVYFTNDGLHFLSASYDKTIHYWDTEKGQVVKTFQIRKYPYCVRFNPDPDRQYAFLCASANKKIAQFDVRTGNRTQQYDEHLGAVNTVTFIENGRKFVSTSDDKKIFLWEFGIPVVVKHMAEPDMHAITSTNLHPNKKYWAGQSADNKVLIYDCKNGNFKMNRKRKFVGHMCAGFSIGVTFSPDGQFIASGDSDGKVFFWDWKSTRNLRSFQAHTQACTGVEWHPIEPSRFLSFGWDGTIKFWD